MPPRLAVLVAALCATQWLATAARAQLVQTVDYSDTFTVAEQGGVPERTDGSYNQGPPAYDVEDSHGNPISTWTPYDHFSFNTGLGSTCCGYPTNDGNPGASSGVAQSGGDDFTIAYGLRTSYVVQLDGILPPDRLDIISVPAAGNSIFTPSSLSVFFRKSPQKVGLYNGSFETHIDIGGGQELETGITDSNWHNYAVHFNQDNGTIGIFVDFERIGVVDLNTFAGGAYLNYSNGAVGAGGTFVLWADNVQVGEPAPLPTTACFSASTLGGPSPLAVDFDAGCSTFAPAPNTYTWDFGDGANGSGATASHTYTTGGNFVVTLTVKDTNGGMDTATKTITVFPRASSFSDNFDRADGPIDGWTVYSVPDTWNLSGGRLTTGPTAEERFIWAGDPAVIFPERLVFEFDMTFLGPGNNPGVGRHGGAVFCGSRPTHRYDPGFSGYFVDWIDRAGDHGLRFTRVDNGVLTELVLGAPGSPAEPPLNWRVEITGQNIRVYGDGVLYIDYIEATYRGGFAGLWLWAGGEEAAFDDVSISEPTNPLTACFTTSGPQLPLSGDSIAFDAACTDNAGAGTINSYAWDFGDTTSASGAQTSHAYAAPGTYTASLKVKDTLGNESTVSKVITIFQRLLTFSDNFDRPDAPVDGWTVFTPPTGWNIQNGELVTGPTDRENWVWAGATPIVFPKTLSAEWDQIFIAPGTNPAVGRHGGLAFFADRPTSRISQGFSGYFVDWIDRAGDHGPRLSRVDNGRFVELVLGIADIPEITPDQEPPLVWRLEVDGDHIRLFGDGVQFFDFVDHTYRGGLIGLWTWEGGQEVSYDNVNISGEPFTACFTSVPSTTALAGSAVTFDASCSEDLDSTITSYSWDFGDGGNASGVTAQHVYAAVGTFTVKLTVKDALNRTETLSRDLDVGEPLLPFADCFERDAGPVDGWTAFQGQWNLDGAGKLSTQINGQEGWLWAGDPPLPTSPTFVAEYDIEFLAMPADGVGRHAGAAFCANHPTQRFDGAFQGYFVDWIDRAGDRGPRFTRVDNGGLVELVRGVANITVPIPPDPPLTWRIEVDATNIRVFGDGVLYIDIADSTYRGGYFGLWGYLNGQDLLYDNVRIGETQLPECQVNPGGPRFVRGDADATGQINLTDAIVILGYLFLGQTEPACFDAADTDDNGQLQLTDAIRVLNWLFIGGPAPPPPSPSTTSYDSSDCGTDPVSDPPDLLDCATFGPCP